MTSSLCLQTPEDQFNQLALRALGIESNGLPSSSTPNEQEVKQIKKFQKALVNCEETRRDAICNSVAASLFGIQLEDTSLHLSQKIILTALLANNSFLDETVVVAQLEKAQKRLRAQTPGIPWACRDIGNLKPAELVTMKIEDIIRHPGVWKDFISASSLPADARRNLMKALESKYFHSLRAMRKDKILYTMSYEVQDILWTVEVLITPRPEIDKIPKIKDLHESMLFHHFERLEGCRGFLKGGIEMGKEYMKLLRAEPPAREKDYEKLWREAEREARKKRVPTSLSSSFKEIVHSKPSTGSTAFSVRVNAEEDTRSTTGRHPYPSQRPPRSPTRSRSPLGHFQTTRSSFGFRGRTSRPFQRGGAARPPRGR